MKIHFASTAFREDDWKEKLIRCRQCAENYGWQFGVQLHNSESPENIRRLQTAGVPLSVHCPLSQDHNWNLSRAHAEDSFAAIDDNIRLLRSLHIHEAVFHGGLMSDLVPEAFGHGKTYMECMQAVYRPELAWKPGSINCRDFTGEPEFQTRMVCLKKNLALLREKYPDMLICLENDYPAFGSTDLFFRDLIKLEHPLCLDTGHLWFAANLLNRDFQQEIETAARSGFVRMCHFHESKCRKDRPLEKWTDGHQKLSLANPEMDLPRALKTLLRGGLDFFVLEIASADEDDLHLFHEWMQ